jgi:glycosyltransferase involved in cell wall biosynthesis
MPKIFISGLFLYPSKVGGAENYFYNLLKGLYKLKNFDKKNIKILINKNIKNYDPILNQYEKIYVNIKTNRGIYDYLLGVFFKNMSQEDLIFSPNYITSIYPFKAHKVTTIHDVQYLYYPEFFSWKKRQWLYLSHKWTLEHANKIVCISNSVKKDILNFFGEKYENKLQVIYNPIDFTRFSNKLNERIVKDKYILSVAAQYPHKNLLTLIKAFNLLNKELGYKLVLTGQIGKNLIGNYEDYYKTLNKEIEKNKNNIIVTGYVNDEILGNLYKNCDLFVFPSLFEGFGMPPVEAMGLGKPTITTNQASLKEVTIGKAIYIHDPYDYQELANLIERVILNIEEYNNKFNQIKYEIRKKYDLLNIAEQYYLTFNKVLY